MAGRTPLRIGHKIALLFEEAETSQYGYVQATWSTGPQSSAPIGMMPLSNRDATPANFEDCIFQILSGDGEVATGKDGKGYEEVKFGQMIRLVHVGQGKTLCCSKKKSGSTDKMSKRVTVEPTNAMKKAVTAKWRIAPRYQVRGEGEKVCDSDQITLQPVLNVGAHFLSVSSGRITGSEFREVASMSKDSRDSSGAEREFGFTIKAYDTADLSVNALRGGDCIMLYHKERRGYLVGNSNEVAGGLPSVRLQLDSRNEFESHPQDNAPDLDKTNQMSNAMFIVEWDDPKQGGTMQAVSWHHKEGVDDAKRFRLRLLGDGSNPFYLTMREMGEEQEENESVKGRMSPKHSYVGSMLIGRKGSLARRRPSRLGLDKLPGWEASLCSLAESRADTGTLFQFLQTGEGGDVDLQDASRVILWANQAVGKKGQQSIFVHVLDTPPQRFNEPGALAVGCSRRPLQKNGFELRKVPQERFLSLTSVLSQIPPIKQYTQELEKLQGTVEDREAGSINVAMMMVGLKLEPDRLLASLEEMIGRCYMNIPDGMDVLDLNGTADRGQQKLLVEQMVPLLCFNLITMQNQLPWEATELFDPLRQHPQPEGNRSSIGGIVNPPPCSLRIALLCYKLISASCRLAPDLATEVAHMIGSSGLQFMLNHTVVYRKRDALRVMPVLVDLYMQNRALQVETDATFVERLMELVVSERWSTQFVRLVPHVISTDTDICEPHQARVASALLTNEGATHPPLMKMRLEGHKLMICTPAEEGSMMEDPEADIDFSSPVEEDKWETLEDFCNVSEDVKCKVLTVDSTGILRSSSRSTRSNSQSSIGARGDELYEYFRLQILLFAKMCMGRGQGPSQRTAQIVKYIPTECIRTVLLDERYRGVVPDGLVSAFVMLFKTATLDDFPDVHEKSVNIVKVMSHFDNVDLKLGCHPSCEELKKACMEYMANHPTHQVRYPTKVERTVTELQNLKLFLQCGFVTTEEIGPLARSLTAVLDGTTDEYLPVPSQNELNLVVREGNVQNRRLYTEESKTLLQARVLIIDIMHIMLDLLNYNDVLRVLDVCKKYLDKVDADYAKGKDIDPDDPDHGFELPVMSALQTFCAEENKAIDKVSDENWMDLTAPRDEGILMAGLGAVTGGISDGLSFIGDGVGRAFGTAEDIPYADVNKLYDVLLDLAQYNFQPLREAAAGLLVRLTNRGQHIHDVCMRTQILSGERAVEFYKVAQEVAQKVIQSMRTDAIEEDATLDFYTGCLMHMAEKIEFDAPAALRVEQQDMLAKTEVHDHLLQAIALWSPDGSESTALVQFLEALFQYMLAITRDHEGNQHLMLKHVMVVAHFLGNPVKQLHNRAYELLKQCFYGNVQNCILAPDTLLRALMTKPNKLPYLPFLFKMMKPQDRTLFRRQQAIYANAFELWENDKNFLAVTQGESWTTVSRKKNRFVMNLLKKKDYLNVDGRIANHLSLVDFVRNIVSGEEMMLKRELRQDVWANKFADPLDHLFSVCYRKEYPAWYRTAYMQLFREVVVQDSTMVSQLFSLRHSSTSITDKSAMSVLVHQMTEDIHRLIDWGADTPSLPYGAASSVSPAVTSAASPIKKVVNFLKPAEEDTVAGVQLRSIALYTDYIFNGVVPLFMTLLQQYVMAETSDVERDGVVQDEFHMNFETNAGEFVIALCALADHVKRADMQLAPGSADGYMRPVSYIELVAHAAAGPDAMHPAAASQDYTVFPPETAAKLYAALRGLQDMQVEQVRVGKYWPDEVQVPINITDGLPTLSDAESSTASNPLAAAEGQDHMKRWHACFDMLKKEPFFEKDKKFSSLCLLCLRKGELGKNFLKRTLIGYKGQVGVLASDRHQQLQIDALYVLAKFCDEYDPLELLAGEGGNDLNIVYPAKRFLVPLLEKEDEAGRGEEDPIELSETMATPERQAALDNFGLCSEMIRLVPSWEAQPYGLHYMARAVLDLGCAMLEGGNSTVQDGMMRVFTASSDELFFFYMRQQLEFMSENLKDLRRTLKKEVTRHRKWEPKKSSNDAVLGGLKSVIPDFALRIPLTKKKRPRERPLLDDRNLEATSHRLPIDVKKEPLPDDCIDTMRDRFNIDDMTLLLRFLQLSTEGHHLDMQNYMREQEDNHTSLDLVETVATFFQGIKFLSRVNADVLKGALDCLIEFIQGPCTANQSLLITLNLGESICKVLNDGAGPKVVKTDLALCDDEEAHEQLWAIKEAAALLLISMMEGSGSTSRAKMLLANVDLDVLAAQMVKSYSAAGLTLREKNSGLGGAVGSVLSGSAALLGDIMKPQGSGSELTDKLNLGCYIFIFHKMMLDAQSARERELGNACTVIWYDSRERSVKSVLRKKENRCYQHFNRIISTIEIARGEHVERVYFRKLNKTIKNLREKSKEEVINTVQRESGDGARVADFFDKCLALIHEIEYYEDMRNTRGLALIHKFSEPLRYVSLFSGLAINVYLMVLAQYENDDTKAHVQEGTEQKWLNIMGMIIIVLQCIHMCHFIVGPTRIYLNFQWREWELHQEDYAMQENKENLSVDTLDRSKLGRERLWIGTKAFLTLQMVLKFYSFWERCAYLVAAFFGYYLTPLFYAVQPLEVVAFSPKLMNVVLAVTTHGTTLLLTLGLMCIVIYFFAAWAFYRFSQYFDEEGDFGPGYNCDTLFRCWILLMTYGLRQGGGIGDILGRPNWSDPLVGERIVFDVLYFLTLIILFLNIVFGIIIDTFAELREKRAFIEEDQMSKCFICGLERSVFDREAAAQGGFDQHYKHEHNMWTYLLFIHYVSCKEKSELTGQEKYVADMMEEKDASFFPIGKSLVLANRDTETQDPNELRYHDILDKIPDKATMEKLNSLMYVQIARIAKLEKAVAPTHELPTNTPTSPTSPPSETPLQV